MKLFFDIETDGLYETVSTCWVIVAKDEATGRVYKFFEDFEGTSGKKDGDVRDGLRLLSSASTIIGHNIIGYDLPVLYKLYGWKPSKSTTITDTLVLSRLFSPDRVGGHSLAAWGERLTNNKGDHNDWTQISDEMITYCIQDVNVTSTLYEELKKEVKGQRWGESIQLEHDVAKIMAKQEVDGCLFDMDLANNTLKALQLKVEAIDNSLEEILPLRAEMNGAFMSAPFKANGTLKARVISHIGEDPTKWVVGPYQPIKFVDVNLSSTHQVKKWLESIGWKPTEFTETGGGKLTEDSFDSLDDKNLGMMLKDRMQIKHRMGQIQGWVDSVREDGRISAQANTCGTPTGRMKHRQVVNVPAAATYPKGHEKVGQLHWMSDDSIPQSTFCGTEMRAMFTVPSGYKMVGHDASGLELRMLAHYMNDPEYTEVLLNGDIHSHNQELAGLHTRAAAKTFIYAFIYGAGDAKLGSIVEGGESEGAAIRDKFLRENPQLNRLIQRAKKAAAERGYLVGLDGRRIWLRRDERGKVMVHKALNTLLQCAGAVVMKKSMVLLNQWATEEGLDFIKVIDMHDEGQAQVREDHAERYAELAVKSIVEAGKHFNLNVPLDGEAKIGSNWAETH